MRVLKYDDFSRQVGQSYEGPGNGGLLMLRLDEAQPIPGSQRDGGGFRLLFRGPVQPQFPQGIYLFRHGGQADQIFIVPIACDPRGTQYEAVFF